MPERNERLGTPFVLTRTFDAPRDLVWRTWTEREHLMRWFGPKGFSMPTASLELREGGHFLYCLHSGDGMELWGKWVFREVVAPERLVLVQSFSDAQGGVTRHPMNPSWPRQTLSVTTFAEHGGRTAMTLHWSPLDATEEEQRTFDAGHASMQQGWGGTLDRLTDYLVGLH